MNYEKPKGTEVNRSGVYQVINFKQSPMNNFTIGDVVALKSDNQCCDYPLLMTVSNVVRDTITCVWKDSKEDIFRERYFHSNTLVKK